MKQEIKKQFIAVDSESNQWLFYLVDGQKVAYKLANHNRTITEEGIVDDTPVFDFSACIDTTGQIHIILFTITRYLIYYKYNIQEHWKRQILSKINQRSQTINNLFITSNNYIHIIYIVQNALRKSNEAIVHYQWNDKEWVGKCIYDFSADFDTRIHKVLFHADGQGIIFFSQNKNSQYELFYSQYDKNSIWNIPIMLYTSSSIFKYMDILYNTNGTIDVAWSANHDIYFNDKKFATIQNENIMPCLLKINDKITCNWIEDNVFFSYFTMNSGETWSHREISLTDEWNFYYIAMNPLNQQNMQINQIHMEEFPNVNFLYPEKDHTSDSTSIIEQKAISIYEKNIKDINQKIRELDEIYNQHTYRLQQLEEKVFQYNRSIFTIEAQIKKILFDLERSQHEKDRIEAITYALHSMEIDIQKIKNIDK